jgi:hypothetical protein
MLGVAVSFAITTVTPIVVTGESLSVDDSITSLTVLRGDEGGNVADAADDSSAD